MTNPASKIAPWLLLFGRAALFFFFQVIFTLGFALAGSHSAWEDGSAWWAFEVTLANLICLVALLRLFHREGGNYWHIFRIRRETVKADLLPLLGTLVLLGPVGFLPNVLLAGWLWDDSEAVVRFLVHPLPYWAVYASLLLFPLTQGLAELPTYFSYVAPRLEKQGLPAWLAVTLPALFLGLQHIFLPFVPDSRYLTWRALMFLPFAFFIAILLRWRPRLLPYLAITHVLMDLGFVSMLLGGGY